MSLFQKSVLNKHLKLQDKDKIVDAFEKLKIYQSKAEKILEYKEEEYQDGFLRDVFVNVLGFTYKYDGNETFNLLREKKNVNDSKKADGAILKEEEVFCVIELKDTTTKDLIKVETQAFGYQSGHVNCNYVIISNFEKLNFYIKNKVDKVEFNLFTATLEEFKIIYLCLHADNLLTDIPLKVKEASLVEDEKVTKGLYKDYSAFKNALWQNLCNNHPEEDKLFLFKKTQKLIDRFLFIFFGEDKGLLPPNSITKIITQWEQLKELDEYKPLYERFKKYFGYLNTGWKGKEYEVFAYNGGLFFPDELLDKIQIDDDVLHPHVMKLTSYDFESDVDVNILGHIFEHSLNEIESITAEIEGKEVDKGKTKRKKDGVFYTPKYITKYIVEYTVGKLCVDKKEEFDIVDEEYAKGRKNRKKETIKTLDKNLQAYRDWLLQISICDPACGSGAFLNQALDFLMQEHKYIDELESQLLGHSFEFPGVESHILENNLFGVDINEESVEIAKLSLWLRTAQKGRKLTSLNNNIKCGNSLIDNVEVAGDKAFSWKKEFVGVFEKGGFDVVIGNPPYVRRTQLKDVEKGYYELNYYSAFKQYDLYILFNELTLYITKQKGLISFIQPNKFLSSDYGYKLRILLKNNTNIKSIYNVSLDKVFEEASVYPYIFVYEKLSNNKALNDEEINLISCCNVEGLKGFGLLLESNRIITKINTKSVKINEVTDNISRGVPNSKLNFSTDGSFQGIKSTTLEYPYYQPSKYLEFNYLNDDSNKEAQFADELILLPRTTLKIRAILKKPDKHVLDRIYYFKPNENYSIKFILSILNSKITTFYYDCEYGSTKIGGGYIDLKGVQIKNFPIPELILNKQQPLIEKADIMLKLNKQLQEQTLKFISRIDNNLEVERITKKINTFYDNNFSTFVKELKKQKVVLTLHQQDEWEEYFNTYKVSINQLQSKINKTEKEIDQMVYELYDLSKKEIQIVESI